jgi:hypothetical protein
MDPAGGIAGSYESVDGLRLGLWSISDGDESVAEVRRGSEVVVSLKLDDEVELFLEGESPLTGSSSPGELEARLAEFGVTKTGVALIGLGRALEDLHLDPEMGQHAAPLIGLATAITMSAMPDVSDAEAGVITGDGFDCGNHSDRPCRTCGISERQCKYCCPRWYSPWYTAYYFCFLNCEACDILNEMPGQCP